MATAMPIGGTTRIGKAAASQTWSAYDFITLNTSGLWEAADASSTNLAVAAEAVTSSAASDEFLYIVPTADQEYRVTCDDVAQALQAEMGDTCDITAAGLANLDATSTNVLMVTDLLTNQDAFGAAAVVVVKIAARPMEV